MRTHLRPLFVTSVFLIAGSLAAQTSRSASYSKGIGNSWLGGNVFASASLSTSTSGTVLFPTSTGNASVYLGADANLLTFTLPAAELELSARNTVGRQFVSTGGTRTTQNASARFRLELAGIEVSNRSVTTTGDLGGIPERTYTLFPTDVRGDIPIGFGISIRVGGNAGVRLGAGANVILPTTVAEVRPTVSATTAVVARGYVAAVLSLFGYSVAGVGVELHGTFAATRLTGSLNASLSTGLSGFLNFRMQAIYLLLEAYGFIGPFRKSGKVTDWSFGAIDRDIISF